MLMMMTVTDVCERLQVGPATIYRWVASGHLRAHKSPGGRSAQLRFSEDDLSDYLAARRDAGAPAATAPRGAA